MKIVFFTSEIAPYSKTGGLADVSAGLSSSLGDTSNEIIVITPYYNKYLKKFKSVKLIRNFQYNIKIGNDIKLAKVYLFKKSNSNLKIYFIANNEYFDREGLYGNINGDYLDNASRFIFFSKASIELVVKLNFNPDVVHCNDWQTGLIPVYIKNNYSYISDYLNTKIIFTIHNLAYQGLYPPETLYLAGLDFSLFNWQNLEYYGQVNFLKAGLVFTDIITTVSEKYALEIQTSEYGYGLEGLLTKRSEDLKGILNGIDYAEWNPETDKLLPSTYSINDLTGKQLCKKELQKVSDLEIAPDVPLLGVVTRLSSQKGIDIICEILDRLLNRNAQLVVLGTGEQKYHKMLKEYSDIYDNFTLFLKFDNVLAHLIEAGSDMFLMPSIYEPCGMNQIYSLKYGTVPVVRDTGGLSDTIINYNDNPEKSTGFKFVNISGQSLYDTITKALKLYNNEEKWNRLVKNCMEQDFSWNKSIEKYLEIYKREG